MLSLCAKQCQLGLLQEQEAPPTFLRNQRAMEIPVKIVGLMIRVTGTPQQRKGIIRIRPGDY
jgi:hypothetical protein